MWAGMSGYVETQTFYESEDVDRRLEELRLHREKLVFVARQAHAARLNTSKLSAFSAPGTNAFNTGVFGLRYLFIEDEWRMGRSSNVDYIRHIETQHMVGFTNVDKACDHNRHPKPISQKGAGAERLSGTWPLILEDLPLFAPVPRVDLPVLYYLMLDREGRAELTRPVVSRSTFLGAVERIFLIPEKEEGIILSPATEEGAAYGFVPDFSGWRDATN